VTHITRFSFIFDVFDLYSMYKLVNNIEKSIVGLFTRKPLDNGANAKAKNTICSLHIHDDVTDKRLCYGKGTSRRACQ